MSETVHGIGASPGRAFGTVRRVRWDVASPLHRTILPEEIEEEIRRFDEACGWARDRIRQVRDETEERVGAVEAKIFDPQILMLEDPDLVDGVRRYIRENRLSAERAFDWRLTEIRLQILEVAHLMIVDRVADLRDIRFRVLTRLAGEGRDPLALPESPSILVVDDLTPALAVQLDPAVVLGLASASGSRASHSAVLARSIGIPAVVGVGAGLARVEEGMTVLVDGGTGRIVLDPKESEIEGHRRSAARLLEARDQIGDLPPAPTTTLDGVRVALRANIDQPQDVTAARRVGAEGVGLFRSEFLVIGRRVIPSETEQYEAYRRVVEGFPDAPVTLRTFDIGGDKFPLFLDMPPEENPYLGWRAIRVCLDLPDLFRNQLRAAIRAGTHGDMRILIPFVVHLDEILATRQIVADVCADLGLDRMPRLGVMVETPALADTLDVVGDHIDFISLGTNDLAQYSLAIDRGNARLQHLVDPLHPALTRAIQRVFAGASAAGLEISACGDLAADPVGLGFLLGSGYRDFSLAPTWIPEMRELVSSVSVEALETICEGLDDPARARTLRTRLRAYLDETVPFEATALSP